MPLATATLGGSFDSSTQLLKCADLLFLDTHVGFECLALPILRANELPRQVTIPGWLRLSGHTAEVGDNSADEERWQQTEQSWELHVR